MFKMNDKFRSCTMKLKILSLLIAVSCLAILLCGGRAQAFSLPDPTTVINGVPVTLSYGDFYSYSLPILAYYYGSSYVVQSSPGQIADYIVIATGPGGGPATTNLAGMDDAYPTPSGNNGSPLFSTGNTTDPAGQFGGDAADTWDMQIDALIGYLTVGSERNDIIYFFNNNQQGSDGSADQNLYAWAQVRVVDTATENPLPTLYFDLTKNPSGPGVYASPGAPNSDYPFGPDGGWPSSWPTDFILSGGQITLPGGVIINHNLGANQAAYAIYSPEINANLETWLTMGYDVLQHDIRFYDLNNGYEQAFIMGGTVGGELPPPIPEPATMLLLGSGLLGLAGFARKRMKK